MDGLMYEQGGIHFDDNDDPTNLTLVDNAYRWSKFATVVFLEAPAGVGFSYSNTSSDYVTNDNITADYNHKAIDAFFKHKFTALRKNPLWISGESYAGIYVPTLSYRVAQDSTLNFKGFAVGNGVT